ncbi:calcium-independent phospholipase A2-gamma isoform X3 [Echinops telfairi]|uniref:Calcium-independent phospholipase A2-gamma isoform X3 n=1 Tax=Echinops telfairi TaxID=9371 RepID=A0AC55CYK4_ECHTE|nr:calcium-independent phospholipase A2-gamma isoform X3 [Echinops telfairi]
MSISLTIDIYIYLLSNARGLCGKQRNKPLHFLCSPQSHWRVSPSSPQRDFHGSRIRCRWAPGEAHSGNTQGCRPSQQGLRVGILKLSTSAPKGLTKVSIRISRIKSTLHSVSKAVLGSQNEMISRLAQLRPSSGIFRKVSGSGWLKQRSLKQAIQTLTKHSGTSAPKSSLPAERSPAAGEDEETHKAGLFAYTGSISTKVEESFAFWSNHINAYFQAKRKMAQTKEKDRCQDSAELKDKSVQADGKSTSSDPGPGTGDKPAAEPSSDAASPSGTPGVGPVSTKQSFANFLSRPTGGVQALVGGYIGVLVPKLKPDPKTPTEEKETPKAEVPTSKDTAAEEKKRLSIQREKIIARVSIDNRTRALVQALRRTTDPKLCISRVEELTFHLLEYPEGKGLAVKERLIPYLLRIRQIKDETLQAVVREILALMGYVDPVKGRGIRILTIDGGGTRGVVTIQTLRKLVELTQKPIHQLFDYICGVSTGAVLAFMLGLFQMDLDECEELYRKLGSDVFSQNVIVGTVKMSWSHAFYDSKTWEKILKDKMGSALMIETARNPTCPKDGGLLLNNPSALAMHECKCLWPDVPLECIVSLGTGRYESDVKNTTMHTSLKTKLAHVINSATDTEEVHIMLDGLLPSDTYFRFNPVMCENIPLDESRNEKLDQLQLEGLKYIERNEEKMRKAAKILSREKTTLQKINDWIKLKSDMYEGLPFFSKL